MRAVPVIFALALLLAACGGDGDSTPSDADGSETPLPRAGEEITVTWAGPTGDVGSSYAVDEENCPETTSLALSLDLPTLIVYEDGEVYWLFETADGDLYSSPGLMVNTGYRLGPMSLYTGDPRSQANTGKGELLLVDKRTPDQSYWYERLGCH
ncbi:MAG: hypothetical protein WD939_00730 [Dehalococcoidia bacterium]